MAHEKEQRVAVHRRNAGEVAPWPGDDHIFDYAMRSFGMRRYRPSRAGEWIPDVDILERKGEILIRADLPGMKREDIDVAVEGDMLIIRGQRREEKEAKEEDYYCSERAVGEFSRAFSLPGGVNAEIIQATYQNGVLEVKMPRPPALEAKRVKVQVK